MSEHINLLFGYISEFSGEFSLLAIFLSVAKYAALGLILGLVLVIVCVKFKFFKRQNKYWNAFAKLYFIFIPIVCIGGGAAFALLEYPKSITNKAVNTALNPVKQEAVAYMQSLPPEIRDNLSVASVKAIVQGCLVLYFEGAATVKNEKPNLFRAWLLSYIADAILDKVNEKVASVTGLDKEDVAKLWQQNLIDIFKSDFLNDLVSQKLNKTINSLQNMLLCFLLLLLAIPMVDTLIAKGLNKRSMKQLEAIKQ